MTARHVIAGLVVFGMVGVAGCASSTNKEPAQDQSSLLASSTPTSSAAPTSAEADPGEQAIYFAFDSSTIDSTHRKTVEAQGRYFAARPNLPITIEGHADERGTTAYNRALGARRAQAIANALSAIGVDSARIRTVSYGEEKPLAREHNEQAWKKNRRGVIIR